MGPCSFVPETGPGLLLPPGDKPAGQQPRCFPHSHCSGELRPPLRSGTEKDRTTDQFHVSSSLALLLPRCIVGDVVPVWEEDGMVQPEWRERHTLQRQVEGDTVSRDL